MEKVWTDGLEWTPPSTGVPRALRINLFEFASDLAWVCQGFADEPMNVEKKRLFLETLQEQGVQQTACADSILEMAYVLDRYFPHDERRRDLEMAGE